MKFFVDFINGVKEAWQKLSLSARVNIVLAGVAVFVVVGMVVYTGVKPNYVTLESNLDGKKINEVTAILNGSSYAYKLDKNGTAILIRNQDRVAVRLLLTQSNIDFGPRVLPGFEILGQSDLVQSKWQQDVQLMQAFTGELQRQLNLFEFVNFATVILRESEDTVFRNDEKPSEAAVTLDLNRAITPVEITAVVELISAAGGNKLHPDNITLVSTDGTLLKRPPSSKFVSMASSKLDLQLEWEAARESKIMRMLQDMGRTGTVTVSATMDFEESLTKTTKVEEGEILSAYDVTSTLTSEESLPEGAPGVIANIADGGAMPGGVNTSEETTESWSTTEPSITVTESRRDGGNVKGWHAALIVEGEYADATEDADGNSVPGVYTGLTTEMETDLREMVVAALGGAELESVVTISDQPFNRGRLAAAMGAVSSQQASQRQQQMLQWGWTVTQIFGILLGFFFIRILLRRAIFVPSEMAEEEEVAEIPEATREDMRRQDVASEITQLALDNPETIAMLLRSWMSEEEE